MRKYGMLSLILIAILLLLVSSCVTRQVPVTETYTETEYRTEYRIETHTETVNPSSSSNQDTTYLSPQTKWYTGVTFLNFQGEGGTYYTDYLIETSHLKNQVQVNLSQNAQVDNGIVKVYDFSTTGPIPPYPTPFKKWPYLQPSEIEWINNLNNIINHVPLLGQVQLGPGAASQILFDASGITEFGVFANTWDAYVVHSVKLVSSDEGTGPTTVTREEQVPYQVPYQVEKQRTVYKTETVPFWEAFSSK
jgi:hypothetical protein